MKREKVLILLGSLIVLSIIIFLFGHFITGKTIRGIYINENYKSEYCIDYANVADTLILLENNTFKSGFYGNGTYEISYSIKGTSINLIYDNGFTKAGFSTNIIRRWTGRTRIILNEHIDHYYEKIGSLK